MCFISVIFCLLSLIGVDQTKAFHSYNGATKPDVVDYIVDDVRTVRLDTG